LQYRRITLLRNLANKVLMVINVYKIKKIFTKNNFPLQEKTIP